jgi:uridine monophosphate synthetase
MVSSFVDKLNASIKQNNSLLCVGLDPDINRIPASFIPGQSDVERQKAFCLDIIDQTADAVCCYKPNIAFFEQSGGEGYRALQDVISHVPVGIPVLLDAKRGDIGNTAKAYARAVFEVLHVDAVTVNPYLGADSVSPFLAYEGKMVFLLCHTSNPSASAVQHHGTHPLYLHVAEISQSWGNVNEIGFVVGATQPHALSAVRDIAPESWILAPGVGAQGANLSDALSAGLNDAGNGLIIPVSRAVLYAKDPQFAAKKIRDQINTCRSAESTAKDTDLKALVYELFNAGCIKFGDFLLASGKTSPIYIDLRRIISYPSLLSRVIDEYSKYLTNITFDRLAAVPYAALPLTGALGMHLQVPIIYPRKEAKSYGTAQKIEGVYHDGQVVTLIEDVITTGGSILSTIQTLERAKLLIKDVVVLVDREQGGSERMRASGYQLHAILTLNYILETLKSNDSIDTATYESVIKSENQ